MAPKRKLKLKNPPSEFKKRPACESTLEDVICPVCQEILVEPVSLPCQHAACLECLNNSFQNNKYVCVVCRRFIGSWLRTNTKNKTLVDLELWGIIQEKFPNHVDRKLKGESQGIDLESVIIDINPIILSSPREIHEEYLKDLEKFEEEQRKMQEKEYEESKSLLDELKQEDEEARNANLRTMKLVEEDEKLAKKLEESDNNGLSVEELSQSLKEDEELARKLQSEYIEQQSSERIQTTPNNGFSPKMQSLSERIIGPLDAFLIKNIPANVRVESQLKTPNSLKKRFVVKPRSLLDDFVIPRCISPCQIGGPFESPSKNRSI